MRQVKLTHPPEQTILKNPDFLELILGFPGPLLVALILFKIKIRMFL